MKYKPLISEEYIKLNRELHQSNPVFGDAGRRWSIRALELLKETDSKTFLDYGCGKGTIIFKDGNDEPLKDIDVRLYDPCIPERSQLPQAAEVVFCTDVLEHIEEEFIDNVLDHLRDLAEKVFFGIVALRPANKTLPDGRNTHILLKSREWWLNQLKERFPAGKELPQRNRNKVYFQWTKN